MDLKGNCAAWCSLLLSSSSPRGEKKNRFKTHDRRVTTTFRRSFVGGGIDPLILSFRNNKNEATNTSSFLLVIIWPTKLPCWIIPSIPLSTTLPLRLPLSSQGITFGSFLIAGQALARSSPRPQPSTALQHPIVAPCRARLGRLLSAIRPRARPSSRPRPRPSWLPFPGRSARLPTCAA